MAKYYYGLEEASEVFGPLDTIEAAQEEASEYYGDTEGILIFQTVARSTCRLMWGEE